jgi:hypothetical protein
MLAVDQMHPEMLNSYFNYENKRETAGKYRPLLQQSHCWWNHPVKNATE